MAKIDGFMKGLELMKPFFDNPDDFMSADHGETILFCYLDDITPESEDGGRLLEYGFVADEEMECWRWDS